VRGGGQDFYFPDRGGVSDEIRSKSAATTAAWTCPRTTGSLRGRNPRRGSWPVETIARAAFTEGLNRILLVAAVIALVSGVISLAAIRGRDFAQQQRPAEGADR
jgi:hypothetical protein